MRRMLHIMRAGETLSAWLSPRPPDKLLLRPQASAAMNYSALSDKLGWIYSRTALPVLC